MTRGLRGRVPYLVLFLACVYGTLLDVIYLADYVVEPSGAERTFGIVSVLLLVASWAIWLLGVAVNGEGELDL